MPLRGTRRLGKNVAERPFSEQRRRPAGNDRRPERRPGLRPNLLRMPARRQRECSPLPARGSSRPLPRRSLTRPPSANKPPPAGTLSARHEISVSPASLGRSPLVRAVSPAGAAECSPGRKPGVGERIKKSSSPDGATAEARGASPVAGWGPPGLTPGAAAVAPSWLGEWGVLPDPGLAPGATFRRPYGAHAGVDRGETLVS
jgi:hypothetical protein